jgi:uncharacterized protein DUF5681
MTDDYKTGYRRPPKASQFKKGQSGNPLGSSHKVRKRKRRQNLSFDEIVLENSEKPYRYRDGNRTSSVSLKEALLLKQNAIALNGNRLAIKASLDRTERAEQNKLAKVLDNYETLLDYRDNYPARVRSHRNRGLPPPLPHPDDIHFDRPTGDLSYIGPSNPEELARLKELLEGREKFVTELEAQRLDAEECASQGCPYSPKDLEFISALEKYIRTVDDELDKRGWLPRIAGSGRHK